MPVDGRRERHHDGSAGLAAEPTGNLIVQDNGVLEACMPNAKINWSQFTSGADVVQAFGSNSVDLGLVGSSPAAKAVSAPLNLPVQVVWIYEVIGEAESLVAREPNINGPADLAQRSPSVRVDGALLAAVGDRRRRAANRR